jgi:hypothetical protein
MRLVLPLACITSRQCPSSPSFNTPLHQGGGSFTAADEEIDAGLPAPEKKDDATVLPATAVVLRRNRRRSRSRRSYLWSSWCEFLHISNSRDNYLRLCFAYGYRRNCCTLKRTMIVITQRFGIEGIFFFIGIIYFPPVNVLTAFLGMIREVFGLPVIL